MWRAIVSHRPAAEVLLAASIVIGAVLQFWFVQERLGFLYFYFLPVSLTAALFGRIHGLLSAGLAAVVVGLPVMIQGLSPADLEAGGGTHAALVLGVWAPFLAATAYVTGYVSETGGNRALVQGIGLDALATVERERRRTAFDIHDGIAQTATTALMQVEVLDVLTEDATPAVREQVQRVRSTLLTATQEIRSMIGHMRPPSLSGPQFDATMSALIEDFSDRTGLKIEFSMAADLGSRTDSLRICIFRVVQEALTNIEQHAGASRVWLSLTSTRSGLFLVIADDGVGFEIAGVDPSSSDGHFGIMGIRERVALLAGRVTIRTAPGEGTTIRVFIPDYRVR